MAERGPIGERGQKGDHGQHGDTGQQGMAGPQGERGEPGRETVGERGPAGDTGERGPRGMGLRHRSTISFIVMTILFSLALAWFARDANHKADEIGANRVTLVEHERTLRKLCEATNESRAINDRDRLTLIRGRDKALKDAEKPENAAVAHLLREAAESTQHEIDTRPYLPPLPGCKAPEPFPAEHVR